MKVTMLQDAPGSPDGVTVNQYGKGETYEVTDALGAVLLSEGLAVVPEPEPERKKKATAPAENKIAPKE